MPASSHLVDQAKIDWRIIYFQILWLSFFSPQICTKKNKYLHTHTMPEHITLAPGEKGLTPTTKILPDMPPKRPQGPVQPHAAQTPGSY
jgi:hypothetical protein